MARRILWELGAPFALREAVCGLIRYHQIPSSSSSAPTPSAWPPR